MNEETYFKKLEELDPELVKIRKMFARSPDDIARCLYEVWENLLLGRKWAEGQEDQLDQQMAGIIKIRITKSSVNLDKNFEVTHPRSIYRKK